MKCSMWNKGIGQLWAIITLLIVASSIVGYILNTYNKAQKYDEERKGRIQAQQEVVVQKKRVVTESKKAVNRVKISENLLNLRTQYKINVFEYRNEKDEEKKKLIMKRIRYLRDKIIALEIKGNN